MNKTSFARSIQIFVIAMVFTFTSIVSMAMPVAALNGSDFKAGRIIDDEIFNNADAMTVAQIQSFLNAKNPNCDNWGTQSYAGTTRRAYSESKGIKFPLVCLKDYYENPTTHANNLTTTDGQAAAIPSGGKSAAEILYSVGQQFSINPQVLIVLLQKEQALVQDDWPWPIQYQSATGYGCPDTAACDSQYYGFYNQVYNAAKQFRRYAQYPNSYGYVSGINNSVQYNPDSSCGASTVYIENQSTASLYNYTPYQPNAAALANLYGSGDSCSAYGNRNFWRYFTDWFGSTRAVDANRIFGLDKTVYNTSTQELFTSTYTQLTMHSWWNGSGGIHNDVISTAPNGERILDFDIGLEPDGTTQAAYIATSTGIYKVTWNGSTFSAPTKIISLASTQKVAFDVQTGATPTYRLYVLADDGPREYWWRSGGSISSPTLLWNINNGLDMVKRTAADGKDELYVATKSEVYRMKWPSGGIERKLMTSIPNTVSVEKQKLSDGTELLYTVTLYGVYESWWKPGTGISSPAKIVSNHSGEVIKSAQKTMDGNYHQLYVTEGNGVYEYWWGNGHGVTGNKLINIPQDDVTRITKTSSGAYQNLYTAQQSFIYETWWGNGKFGNGPAIVDIRQ